MISYFQGKLDNLETQISSMTTGSIGRSKEEKEMEMVLERNMPRQLQEINSNIKILKSKLKELEKKMDSILIHSLDSIDIQIEQQSHTFCKNVEQ